MECLSTLTAIALVEDDAISLGLINREVKLFLIDTCSDITRWIPWNRLEGVNSYFSNLKMKRRIEQILVCE